VNTGGLVRRTEAADGDCAGLAQATEDIGVRRGDSSLDAEKAEHFAATINQLKGKVTMLFITHALPKNLLVDEVVRIGC
jgi:hypothetical protein